MHVGEREYYVECQNCDMCGPAAVTRNDAILAWNQNSEIIHE